MKRVLMKILLLTAKDLRIEARSRQTLGLVVVLGILIIVVLGLGLGADGRMPAFSATAILISFSRAASFMTGSTPGIPMHTGQVWALGGAPNFAEHPQNSLLSVLSRA